MISPQTVAVTGASGFVGSHIAIALQQAGFQVIGVVRNPARAAWLETLGIQLRAADVADVAALAEAFAGVDAVISNAAIGSNQGTLEDMVKTNRDGVRNTLDAAAQAGARRIVHISSVSIYRTSIRKAIAESHPQKDTSRRRFDWSNLTTDWRYAHSKTLAEAHAWEVAVGHGQAMTSLRPSPVYGARDPKATTRLALQLGGPVRFVPTVGVPWVHAGDVAAATVGALNNPASIGQAYNLAGTPISQFRFMAALRAALEPVVGRRLARLVPVPLPLQVAFDTAAAARDLGFVPRDLEAGLREAVAGLEAATLDALRRR
jgi:nucleoside-diphosphate-sugar epimerase